MRSNLGKTDQLVRLSGGMLVVLFGLLLEIEWGVLGFVPVLTGMAGWCPVYALLGITTKGGLHRVRGTARSGKLRR